MSASEDVSKIEKKLEKLRAERSATFSDPAAMHAIDAQIRELEGQRSALEEEAALAKAERAAARSSTKDD